MRQASAGLDENAFPRRDKVPIFAAAGRQIPRSVEAGGAHGPRASSDRTPQPTTIKKYANRRLYNTGTSAYVTLEDLATMVKTGEDFVVHDAKTGEDITRSVLTQIIFEQESKAARTCCRSLLAPADPFLRRQHADAGAELPRILDRQAGP